MAEETLVVVAAVVATSVAGMEVEQSRGKECV